MHEMGTFTSNATSTTPVSYRSTLIYSRIVTAGEKTLLQIRKVCNLTDRKTHPPAACSRPSRDASLACVGWRAVDLAWPGLACGHSGVRNRRYDPGCPRLPRSGKRSRARGTSAGGPERGFGRCRVRCDTGAAGSHAWVHENCSHPHGVLDQRDHAHRPFAPRAIEEERLHTPCASAAPRPPWRGSRPRSRLRLRRWRSSPELRSSPPAPRGCGSNIRCSNAPIARSARGGACTAAPAT